MPACPQSRCGSPRRAVNGPASLAVGGCWPWLSPGVGAPGAIVTPLLSRSMGYRVAAVAIRGLPANQLTADCQPCRPLPVAGSSRHAGRQSQVPDPDHRTLAVSAPAGRSLLCSARCRLPCAGLGRAFYVGPWRLYLYAHGHTRLTPTLGVKIAALGAAYWNSCCRRRSRSLSRGRGCAGHRPGAVRIVEEREQAEHPARAPLESRCAGDPQLAGPVLGCGIVSQVKFGPIG
jgi:hypothetical protein